MKKGRTMSGEDKALMLTLVALEYAAVPGVAVRRIGGASADGFRVEIDGAERSVAGFAAAVVLVRLAA